jgi:hypothetical protein
VAGAKAPAIFLFIFGLAGRGKAGAEGEMCIKAKQPNAA